ncbi:MAG: hypothetical protein ACE5EJ_02225 [Nitrosopumilaceae archaeon]
MVKDEPVSLTRQTIYCMIPFLDIYAAYRVKVLRKYLLIMIPVIFAVGSIVYTIFPVNTIGEDFKGLVTWLFFLDYVYDTIDSIPYMIQHVGLVLLAIYLVRRWSKQWNKKF